jgi:hypothetical protein
MRLAVESAQESSLSVVARKGIIVYHSQTGMTHRSPFHIFWTISWENKMTGKMQDKIYSILKLLYVIRQ